MQINIQPKSAQKLFVSLQFVLNRPSKLSHHFKIKRFFTKVKKTSVKEKNNI